MGFSANIILSSVFLSLSFSACFGLKPKEPQLCLIGDGVYKTRFFCPGYDGKDQVYCCGELENRYCCSREQYESELNSGEKSLSPREHYEDIVIKKRFRYEDGALHPLKAKVALLDKREEIIMEKEEQKEMRPVMLMDSIFIHVLGSVISMGLCLYLIFVMMRRNQAAPQDPEKVPFLQERYTEVPKL